MKRKITGDCCSTATFCKVEALVSIDERGQMVLPKDAREKAGISPGDKLAVISWGTNEQACCLGLMKADALTGMIKEFLGPIIGETFQQK